MPCLQWAFRGPDAAPGRTVVQDAGPRAGQWDGVEPAMQEGSDTGCQAACKGEWRLPEEGDGSMRGEGVDGIYPKGGWSGPLFPLGGV